MSEVPGALETLKDDDVVVFFRAPAGQVRRKAERTTRGAITRAILARHPTVKGEKGDPGASVKGDKGDPGKDGVGPKPDRYTGTVVGGSGTATILFGKTYGTVYPGQVLTTWVNNQMVTGTVTDTKPDRATVSVRISVATLLIGASPFGVAPAGTPVTIEVFGF